MRHSSISFQLHWVYFLMANKKCNLIQLCVRVHVRASEHISLAVPLFFSSNQLLNYTIYYIFGLFSNGPGCDEKARTSIFLKQSQTPFLTGKAFKKWHLCWIAAFSFTALLLFVFEIAFTRWRFFFVNWLRSMEQVIGYTFVVWFD